jgi:WD40 repeat protein
VIQNNFLLKLQAIPNSEKEELLDLPRYFVKTCELDEYIGILLDFQFVTAKISILDIEILDDDIRVSFKNVEPLIKDYDLVDYSDLPISTEDKSDLKAIQKIYRLATTLGSGLPGLEDLLEESQAEETSKQNLLEHINFSTYRKIQNQLAGQLWGRFSYSSSSQMIRSLLDQARDSQNEPWLRPVFPTLTNPSSYLNRVITGHRSNITAIAITPDGKHLISGEMWGEIILWNLENETFIRRFDNHKSPQVDFLDPIAYSLQQRFYNNYIVDIAITQDGKYFISGSWDGTLIVWDLEKKLAVHQLVHKDYVALQQKNLFAEIQKNSRNINPESEDEFIDSYSKWRWDIGEILHSFILSEDSDLIIASYFDQSLIVWDIKTGKELHIPTYPILNYHAYDAYSRATFRLISNIVEKIPHSNQMLLKTSAEDVLIYELDTDKKLNFVATIEIWDDDIRVSFKNLVAAPNGEIIVFESGLHFWVWSVQTRTFLKKIDKQNQDNIQCLQITPDSKWLISISSDKTLIVTDIDTSNVIAKISEQAIRGEWKVIISPDGQDMIGYVGDKKIKIWDLKKLESFYFDDSIEDESQFGKTVYDITFTPDGKKIVLGRGQYKIKILDLADNCSQLLEIDGNKVFSDYQYIRSITVSPNSQRIISSSGEGNVHVWDITSGQMLTEFLCHPLKKDKIRDINSIAITPDAKYIITASADNSLKIWELQQIKILRNGQIIVKPLLYKELIGHTDEVKSVMITPDGKRAISGSQDGTVKVWDILTGKELNSFNCQSTNSGFGVGKAILSFDGKQIFSVHERNLEVKIWYLEFQENSKTLDLKTGSIPFGDGLSSRTDGHGQPITDIVVTPDNRYLVTCSYHDSTVMLWDLHDLFQQDLPMFGDQTIKYRPKLLSSFSFETLLNCCAISPDGKTIAVGDEFNNAHILQIENIEFDKSLDLAMIASVDKLSSNLTFEDNIISLELYKKILDLEEKQSISKFPHLKLFIFNFFIPFAFIIVNSLTQIELISIYLLNLIPPYFNLSISTYSIRAIIVLSITLWLCAAAMRSLAGKARTNLNRISKNTENTFKVLLFLFPAFFITPILADIGSINGRNLASKEYWILFIIASFFVFIFTKIERYVRAQPLDFINPIVLIGSSLSPLLGSHQILGSIYWSVVFSILFSRIIDASNWLVPLKKVVYFISISCGIVFALVMNHYSDSVYWDATIPVVLGISIWNIAFHSDESYSLKNPPLISLTLGVIIGIIVNSFFGSTFLKFISSSLVNICSIIGFLMGGALGLIGAGIIAGAMFGLIYILFILPLSIVDEGLQRLIIQVRTRTN